MNAFLLFILGLFIIGCVSQKKVSQEVSVAQVKRPTLLEEKKKSLVLPTTTFAKGKFLDYIFQIQPDHKKPGYSISTKQLDTGYAYGSGPYDGWIAEFFLFRGKNHDIVLKQETGYEVPAAKQKYGASITAYTFVNSKMLPTKLSDIWPVKAIDILFEKKIRKLKKTEYKDWSFHQLVKLPIEGTTSLVKVCQKSPEPPFATATDCLTIGEIIWSKEKFELKSLSSTPMSKESI
ncbi:MAG: hypothetical protein JNL11_19735 [Bdellovibrionaceae bacterium]|nr:hypothetical protein [Pseudobdellovibrionaceae bacterium]